MMWLWRNERHPTLKSEFSDEFSEVLSGGFALMPTWTTNNDERHIIALTDELANCSNGKVGSLQRLQPPNEQAQRPLARKSNRTSSGTTITGSEERVIDPKRNDPNARRVSVVEVSQLLGFNVTRCQHRIGTTNHGCFSNGPTRHQRLRRQVWVCFRLHSIESVKRTQQWEIKFMLQRVSSDCTQPVVGVDRIEATAICFAEREAIWVSHCTEDFVGECPEVVLKFSQRNIGHRTRFNVVHSKVWLDEDDIEVKVTRTPREDVARNTESRQGRRHFTDIDVHATTVANTGLIER